MRDINELCEMLEKLKAAAERIKKRLIYYHGTSFSIPSYASEQLTDIDIIKNWVDNIKYDLNCMNGECK